MIPLEGIWALHVWREEKFKYLSQMISSSEILFEEMQNASQEMAAGVYILEDIDVLELHHFPPF